MIFFSNALVLCLICCGCGILKEEKPKMQRDHFCAPMQYEYGTPVKYSIFSSTPVANAVVDDCCSDEPMEVEQLQIPPPELCQNLADLGPTFMERYMTIAKYAALLYRTLLVILTISISFSILFTLYSVCDTVAKT